MKITKEIAQTYFEGLVKYQPDDVVNLLIRLFDNELSQTTFINDTINDIIDVYED